MAGVSGGPWGLPKSRPASCCGNADEMAGATAATLGPQKEGCAQRTGMCKLPAQECSQDLIALYPQACAWWEWGRGETRGGPCCSSLRGPGPGWGEGRVGHSQTR